MSEKKTLLPELLPAPTSSSRPGSGATAPSPVERVAEQARLMLQRFRGLGPVAGAALLGLHGCGYGVVDPLPPPPVQCTTLPMPFANLSASASLDYSADAGLAPVILTLTAGVYPGSLGLRIDAVRVTGATLLGEVDTMPSVPTAGHQFAITIAPEAVPSTFLVDIDFGCGPATLTKHYRVTDSAPGDYPSVEELPGS